MKRFVAPALLVLACSGQARAAPGFSAPAGGVRLPSGRHALATFELPRGLSRVDEMELVLSLDGGETFPLRLTGELEPGTRRVAWRVPALPTERAALALRTGDEDGDERIVLVSGAFAIVGDPSAAPEDIRFAEGEWRTREAGFEGVLPFAGSSLGTGPEEGFSALATSTDFTDERSRSLVRSLPADGPLVAIAGVGPRRPVSRRVPRLPLAIPKRE